MTETQAVVRKIVLVGHCVPDKFMLSSAMRRAAPGVEIEAVNSSGDLSAHAGPQNLWLVNRVLDGAFEKTGEDSGIELIAEWAQRADAPRMILVSNFPESQRQAERAGAWPGFGKSDIGSEGMKRKVEHAIGPHEADMVDPGSPPS